MSDHRIFYITATRLVVYWSLRHTIHEDLVFNIDDDGYAQFNEYLQTYADTPSFVLLDVIDEEYQIDTIPHVSGRDRKAVLDRKLKQTFHASQYYGAEIQARDDTGRRDDQVLMTALTASEPLEAWFNLMLENKVPVIGIYSLPMLAQFFVKKLNIISDNFLLFIPRNGGMIRQIYLSHTSIKISRLLPVKNNNVLQYHDFLNEEAVKNQRYLQRLRLLMPGDILNVYILCETKSISELKAACKNSDNIHYHFITLTEAIQRLDLDDSISLQTSERLFVRLLPKYQPKINYANSKRRHYHQLYRTRRILFAASIFMIFGFLSLATQTMLDGLELQQQTINLKQQRNILTDKYNIAYNQLPKTDISPRNMQNAVNIVTSLDNHKTNPQLMMSALSKGLANYPNIQVNEIRWLSSNLPHIVTDSENEDNSTDSSESISSQNRYQIALFRGQLKFFRGNYKVAFSTIKNFVNTLRNNPIFIKVTAVKYPLDIDSSSTLSMTSGKNSKIHVAEFEIRVVIEVHNENV